MNLFLGEYEHKLDSKGRVCLPRRILEGIANPQERDRMVITLGLDPCLYLFTRMGFVENLRGVSRAAFGTSDYRQMTRGLGSRSVEQNLDAQNRVLLPEDLRKRIELGNEVVVVGAIDHVEIWDRGQWREQASLEAEDSYLKRADAILHAGSPDQGEES